jgi:hypothetical protein
MSIVPTPPIGGAEPAPRRVAGAHTPAGPPPTAPVDRVELSSDIPASPPLDVLEQVAVAGRTLEELHERGRELRFATDHPAGSLVIEVRDLDGNVLRTIGPAEALDIAMGETEA